MAGEEDLDASAEKIARDGVLRAERLRFDAGAASIKTRGKDAGVVEDDEIVWA